MPESTRQGGNLTGKFVGGAKVGVDKLANGPFDLAREFEQDADDGLTIEGLSLTQAYREGWLDLCYLVKISHRAPLISGHAFVSDVGQIDQVGVFRAKHDISHSGGMPLNDSAQFGAGHSGGLSGQENNVMFISVVETPDAPEISVPCRVGFEVMDRLNNLFAGKPYLSLINGSINSLGFPRKRELDLVQFSGSGAGHCVDGQIEGGSQIVNRVPDNETKFVWDGFLDFGAQYSLPGLRFMMQDQLKRFLTEKNIDSLIEIVDVVLGPLDFQRGPVS
jgi:hypothetical protein